MGLESFAAGRYGGILPLMLYCYDYYISGQISDSIADFNIVSGCIVVYAMFFQAKARLGGHRTSLHRTGTHPRKVSYMLSACITLVAFLYTILLSYMSPLFIPYLSVVILSFIIGCRLNFPIGRLKTGTPARLINETIDYDGLEKQYSDYPPVPFSALNAHNGVSQKDNLGNVVCAFRYMFIFYKLYLTVNKSNSYCSTLMFNVISPIATPHIATTPLANSSLYTDIYQCGHTSHRHGK